MTSDSHFDVIIIGSGAGGGTLLRHLASSGKRILLLERGDFLPQEPENWQSRAVLVNGRYANKEIWHDAEGKPFGPQIFYYVGGNTKMFGAAMFRFRKEDFGEVRHHDGVSPAWPISYEDIEPYYSQAEQLYEVRGQHGVDPTEPFSSRPYSFPPLEHEPQVRDIHERFRRVGCHPFPMPMGVMRDDQNPANSKCIRCNTCDPYPCMIHAKCDAEVIGVRPALKHDNVVLLTRSLATKLVTSPSGREVVRVIVERNGESRAYSADLFVLAAGAANSAKLLLMSANDRHPHGLANGSGQVGRNFMLHNLAVVIVHSRRKNNTVFQKTYAVNDFYFGSETFEFPMGNIQSLSKMRGDAYRRAIPRAVPGLVLNALARRAFEFFLITEDLPDPNNRLTVNDDGRITLAYRRNNLEPMTRLIQQLKSLLKKMGGPFRWSRFGAHHMPLSGLGHQCGTCRFGRNAEDSVLDENCKSHELENLYVVDASFFPSSAALNPALTVMANALRVGDHLLERIS